RRRWSRAAAGARNRPPGPGPPVRCRSGRSSPDRYRSAPSPAAAAAGRRTVPASAPPGAAPASAQPALRRSGRSQPAAARRCSARPGRRRRCPGPGRAGTATPRRRGRCGCARARQWRPSGTAPGAVLVLGGTVAAGGLVGAALRARTGVLARLVAGSARGIVGARLGLLGELGDDLLGVGEVVGADGGGDPGLHERRQVVELDRGDLVLPGQLEGAEGGGYTLV